MINILDLAPTRSTVRSAAIVSLLLGVIMVAVWPFAAVQWPIYGSFQVFYGTSYCIACLLTSVLLFARAKVHGKLSSTVLASAYLYSACMVVVYVLSFPNVVTPSGLLHAAPSTSLWLWTFWHGGFPLITLFYILALTTESADTPKYDTPNRLAIGTVLLVVSSISLVSIFGTTHLPKVINGLDYHLYLGSGIGYIIIALSIGAYIALLGMTRIKTVAQLWVSVTLLAGVFDVVTALMSAHRWTVSWYAARLGSLLEASVFLVVLLVQTHHLYRRTFYEAPATNPGGRG